MGRTVVAVFESAYVAKKAYSELLHLGCAKNYISLYPYDVQGETLKPDRAESVHSETVVNELQAGSAIGAGVGGSIGIAGGLLVALGRLTIPLPPIAYGSNPLFFEIAALIGIGLVAGAILGCLLSGLVGLGIPESEIEQYAKTVQRSNVTLLVVADKDSVDDMMAVLEAFRPLDIQQKPIGWKQMRRKEEKHAS